MNEELQKQLATMLAKLADVVQSAAGQIPPLVQEKITLGRIEETVYVLIGLVLLLAVIPLVKRIKQADSDEEAFVLGLANVALLLVGSFVFFGTLHSFLQVWLTPRLYVVEWLSRLAR